MARWIELDRAIVEHRTGFRVLDRRPHDYATRPIEVRRVIPIADHRRPHSLPSTIALLRQNLAQRIQEWRDRRAERERGTELTVQRIHEAWERKR